MTSDDEYTAEVAALAGEMMMRHAIVAQKLAADALRFVDGDKSRVVLVTKEVAGKTPALGGVMAWAEVDRVQYGKIAFTHIDEDGDVRVDLLRHEHDTADA